MLYVLIITSFHKLRTMKLKQQIANLDSEVEGQQRSRILTHVADTFSSIILIRPWDPQGSNVIIFLHYKNLIEKQYSSVCGKFFYNFRNFINLNLEDGFINILTCHLFKSSWCQHLLMCYEVCHLFWDKVGSNPQK